MIRKVKKWVMGELASLVFNADHYIFSVNFQHNLPDESGVRTESRRNRLSLVVNFICLSTLMMQLLSGLLLNKLGYCWLKSSVEVSELKSSDLLVGFLRSEQCKYTNCVCHSSYPILPIPLQCKRKLIIQFPSLSYCSGNQKKRLFS